MSQNIRRRIFLTAVAMLFAVTSVISQELYCNVQVSAQKIQGSNEGGLPEHAARHI